MYRVSANKQVDYDADQGADIPMQRKACRRVAAEKGWIIVHEEQEEDLSGHKVRAESGDKLQIIREHALKGRFNIMPDRTGRIADEWI